MVFTEEMLQQCRRLHMIGVGGSGMFPIAQILLTQGFTLSGSDNNPGETIDQERAMGVTVTIGHAAENVHGADAVIYSAAIMQNNVELVEARRLGIPTVERSEMLGLLTRRYGNCVCISGTHGKTTTTSMTTMIFLAAGMDPSTVIGGKLKAIGGSGRAGKSDTMVVEACEYSNTFLHLAPDVSVILNIDDDHLEFFKTMENLRAAFRKFAELTSRTVVFNGDDENTRLALDGLTGKELISYGLSEQNDYCPANLVRQSPTHLTFDLMHRGENLGTLELCVPGQHNVLNAVAAAAASLAAGAPFEAVQKGLAEFHGVHRRLEIFGTVNGITVADDYAHHPTELEATLKTCKGLGYNSVWAIFQPFTFSRTALLLDDFARVLPIADHVVMTAIMGGREINTYGITTQALADKIPGSVWFETFEEVRDYVLANAKPGDFVITLGCGDCYKCANMILGR